MAGILLTGVIGLFGVVLNFFVPEQAFEVVLNIASVGTMASWAAIAMSHQKYLKLVGEGKYKRPKYRAPGGRFSDWAVMVFLAVVLVLMALLIIGWYTVRDRVNEIARVREGYTGAVPVIAARPVVKKLLSEPRTHIALDEFVDDEDHGTTHKGHHDKP